MSSCAKFQLHNNFRLASLATDASNVCLCAAEPFSLELFSSTSFCTSIKLVQKEKKQSWTHAHVLLVMKH